MDFFLLWIFPGIILGGLGSFLLLTTIKHIKRCEAVANWSKAQATIEASSVKERRIRRNNSFGSIRTLSKVYEPRIEYSYTVMGMPFHSSGYRNFAGEYATHSEEEATLIAEAFPVGKAVTTSYDPNNPSDALLQPETSTEKLNKIRKGQLVMLVVALAWVCIGAGIKLSAFIGEKDSEARIQESAGILPGSADKISAKMDPLIEKYQLTCEDDGTSGVELAYHIWACRADPGSDITTLEMLNRKEDLQKVDMLSAVFTPSDIGDTAAFFGEAAAIIFEGNDLQSVQNWITDSLPTVAAGEGNQVTIIGGIDLALDSLGGTIRLNIGDLQ